MMLNCSSCRRPIEEHCDIHVIPCCPGKCTGRREPVPA